MKSSVPSLTQSDLESDLGSSAEAQPATIDGSEKSWAGLPLEQQDPLVGTVLNETYVIEAVLGEGGMGRVYRAHHTRIEQKKYAIKMLHAEFTRNTEVVTRFQREAEAAACISHPNIVGVYDVDTTVDRQSYLVCEFLDGLDLAAYLEQSRPSISLSVHIAVQMCLGLEAAHAQGVIHRDLKPHNVFILSEGGLIPEQPRIKVLDFGLSRFMDATGTALTRTGVVMGTPAYMPPEQAAGKGVDHRVDIYGVGAVLFTALTGSRPFEADTLQAVLLRVLTTEPTEPRSLNPEIPEALQQVVLRSMAKDPEYRYATMAELRRALEPFVEESVPAPPTIRRGASSDTYALSPTRSRVRMLSLGFGVLLALISGLSSSLPSLELVTGRLGFSSKELSLIALAVVGTLLTPGLLFIRRFRSTVWNSPMRVASLVVALQKGLFSGVAAYGLGSLVVHFLDNVVGRFGLMGRFSISPGPGWAGWNLLYLILALLVGCVAALRDRWIDAARSDFRRALVSRGSVIATLLLSGAVLYSGYVWRNHAPGLAPQDARSAIASETVKPTASAQPASKSSGAQAAPPSKIDPKALASSAELAQASAKGVDGLLPLSERYPRDPSVLKPLVLAFASRATGLKDAMIVAGRLFELAPAETRDTDLRFLVRKAAQTPGESSRLAFALMTDSMGDAGPDLLYDLMLTDRKVGKQAGDLLSTAPLQEKATPALSVAYALRTADSCAARLPLLEQAAQLGDERASQILLPLSVGSKRGCGRWKRNPCLPPCPDEARRYSEAVARISTRLAAARR